jgi:SPP1 family phage portal protein
VFTRNIPSNDVETVNMIKQLYGMISDKTLLSQLPFIEDVQAELEALQEQKENTLDYNNLGVENE